MKRKPKNRIAENERACRGVFDAISNLSDGDKERVLWSVLLELQRHKDAVSTFVEVVRIECDAD